MRHASSTRTARSLRFPCFVTESGTRLVPELYSRRTEACVTEDLASVLEALPVADLAANDYAAQGAHAGGQRGSSRLLQLESKRTNLLIEGEQRRPVELKVGWGRQSALRASAASADR